MAEPYKTYIDGDPFYVNINKPHYKAPEEKINLSKKQMVGQMIRWQQLAERDKTKAALCNYQLANAWYNLTYFGKNWLMVKQWWSSVEISHYDAGFKKSAFNDDYYGCDYAKQFYLKAMAETKDKNLKKLSAFMVSVCEENRIDYNWSLKHKDDQKYSDNEKRKSLAANLKRIGIDQKYYDEVVQECELYQSYINRYHARL